MFPEGKLPARRFAMEELLFLLKQEMLVSKEQFAHICTSCPTLLLCGACALVCSWCWKLLQTSRLFYFGVLGFEDCIRTVCKFQPF